MATFVVDNLSDSGAGSLRQAVEDANNAAGADEIRFEGSAAFGTINLTSGQISITDPLTVVGPGAADLTIDARQNSRIFSVPSGESNVTIQGLTLTGGFAFDASGGAILFASTGSLTIQETSITGNSATANGGGIFAVGDTLTITNSTVSDNMTTGRAHGGGGISVNNNTVNIVDSRITGNRTLGLLSGGGGIQSSSDVTNITRSTVSDNSTAGNYADGGGILVFDGELNVVDSTISGNSTEGIAIRYGGGGIFIQGGNLNVSNSTISGNTTTYNGGGIFHHRIGSVTISNSTVVENTAQGDGGGGGIFVNFPYSGVNKADLTITSSIIAGNTATAGAPELVYFGEGQLTVSHSLVGDNTGTPLGEAQMPDVDGNLIGTSVNPIDPLLAPLADNGGGTQTHALIVGSPAIDAGANPDGLAADQRGLNREAGAAADIGAFEVGLVVTTADDEDDADTSDPNDLSLREAIGLANANGGPEEITFSPLLAGTTIELQLGRFDITEAVALRGLGRGATTIDGLGRTQLFRLDENVAEFSLHELTLTGAGTLVRGGVIESLSDGTIHIARSTITGNSVGRGAIYTDSDVTIESSTLSDNVATTYGAVRASGNVTINDSIISNNFPGAIAGGRTTIRDSVVTGNSSDGYTGAIGGSRLTILNSTVTDNHADDYGGALYGQEVRVVDSFISGNSAGRGGGAIDAGYLLVQDSIITNNFAANDGGAIRAREDVTIINSTISGNTAGRRGGGLYAHGYLIDINVSSSTISGNTSGDGGGGIHSYSGNISISSSTIDNNTTQNDNAPGGGVYALRGPLTISSSTISGNRTVGSGADGAGVYAALGPVTISNSTLTGNTAADSGGGVFVRGYDYLNFKNIQADLTLASSIVAGNTAGGAGPDFVPDGDGMLAVTNSLIGDNDATTLDEAQTPSADGNLVGDASGGGLIDPRLAQLGSYGGPTRTHALLPDSPAINIGAAGSDTTDQRGFPRDDGNGVDMGAFESFGTFVVTSTGNNGDVNIGDGVCDDGSGNCTLLAAINEINKLPNPAPAPALVLFDISGIGPHIIRPQSALPIITHTTIIDGTSEPDYDAASPAPVVELDGTSAGAGASGLRISSNADASTIRGLAINRFDAHGIVLSRATGAVVEGNYLGTDVTGSIGRGNGEAGVQIINGENNTVFGNLISGNEMGLVIEGPLSSGNVLQVNVIGAGADGNPLKNRLVNVDVAAAPNNVIGGPGGLGNVVVGSKVGIGIRGSQATGNMVLGNFIGNSAFGTAIANNRGVEIKSSATNNTIGGPGDAGNVISGNTKGVLLSGVENNLVQGNKIGTNADGDAALPNVRGVLISGAANNQIGDEPNVISGNTRDGLRILGSSATGNVISDNFIGTNADGTAAIPNRDGVLISPGADGNTIGGTTAAERNVISGNTDAGIVLQSDGNTVMGNHIGTHASCTSAVGNETGVLILGGSDNTIGGPVGSGAGNVISGNTEEGIRITGDGAAGNSVTGNLVGTDCSGMVAVGNKHGVRIESGGNTVGGLTANDGNVISGNTQNGVYLLGSDAVQNDIYNNRIGINIDGSGAVANARSGVLIEDAPGNKIGGADRGNSIGGNTQQGIRIAGAGATGNTVEGNSIGLDRVTMTAIANRDGVRITDNASNNTIGGTDGSANEIAFNTGRGVWISSGMGNTITQNSIHDNGGLGIDLRPSGNNLQAAPNLTAAISSGGTTTVTGTLNSTANSTFTIEFFSSPTADPSGFGEGETFLGSAVVNTSGGGDGTFAPSFSVDVPNGHFVTATATDAGGSTSEFSAVQPVSSMLLAAAGPAAARPAGGSPAGVSANELHTVAGAAIDRLVAAGFAADLFANVEFAVADLPGGTLGLTTGNTITIDINAAAYGWFVDATPLDDSEFFSLSDSGAGEIGTAADIGAFAVGVEVTTAVDEDDHTTDPGVGAGTSLREAIHFANANPGPDTITFNIPIAGVVHSIVPTMNLPPIVEQTTLDATTQPGYTGTPLIQINGAPNLGPNGIGLKVNADADGSIIRGFNLVGFFSRGIFISRADDVKVEANFIGTTPDGTMADPGGGNNVGVLVVNGANNTIGGNEPAQRNLIGHNRIGVSITGARATGNVVAGNLIGTDITATAAIGNTTSGIEIATAPGNIVGGPTPDDGNVISANENGVYIRGSQASGNQVMNNLIGTNATGTVALGNIENGIYIQNGADSNTVASNVISGNLRDGVHVSNANLNTIRANTIGTDVTGTLRLANRRDGVEIRGGSIHNTIGGPSGSDGNVISGNSHHGIRINADLNQVQGNRIGTDVRGSFEISNRRGGVLIVRGNLIGTDVSGTQPLGNKFGVYINRATSSIVGGTNPEDGNTISGNDLHGVFVSGQFNERNRVEGNRIGLDAGGTAALPNGGQGVLIDGGARSNTIGGTEPGAQNVISANAGAGVKISGFQTANNRVLGNVIGTNASGTTDFPNRDGVLIVARANNNSIGDGTTEGGNIITGNKNHGVWINSHAGAGNSVRRNSIHDNGGNEGLGIDIGPNGQTPNDDDDPDVGANNLQNAPVIGTIVTNGPNLEIAYVVRSSAANSDYSGTGLKIEFFIADSDGQEGETFVADQDYTTPRSQSLLVIPSAGLIGKQMVATATDASGMGSTSEFSEAINVPSVPLAVDEEGLLVDMLEGDLPKTASDELLADDAFAEIGAE